jgi:prepilin-type N-terminal cleavage/methylation domain-containing protein
MEKGFTLIELLIVVAIIGILAAVGVTVIPGILEKAKITAARIPMIATTINSSMRVNPFSMKKS